MNFPWLVLGALGAAAISGAAARVTRQYAAAAVAGSAAILLLHSRFYFHYTSDDAYISYRYARNLSDGVGLVWNPGQHVEGYSNFLWVALLALIHLTGDDIVLTGRWLGFTLAVVAGGLTYRAIAAGGEHTCAIGTDNIIYCWGGNRYGQLGIQGSSTELTQWEPTKTLPREGK